MTLGARLTMCAAGLAATMALAGPAAAQGERVVDLDRSTTVREYAGWVLFSRWDGSNYRLSTWDATTRAVRDLPVEPQPSVFDADAGPDSDGRPSAVVSICRGSCDLYVIGFDEGDSLRPVRNANTRGHDEVAPSVWRGRLVFGRRYSRNRVLPYTKMLNAPRSRPSSRLADLPDRRCGAPDPPSCRTIKDTQLFGMDLWGRWVAQSWTYQAEGLAGLRQNEIRLTDTSRTETRQLAYMSTGLGGQTYLGPSIAEGRVAFARVCQGDPQGCRASDSGPARYRISTGAYEQAGEVRDWYSWVWSGASDYHVPSAYDCSVGAPNEQPRERCGIYRRNGPLPWRPAPASRFRG